MVDEISRQRDGAEKDARKDEGECPSDGRFRTYAILTLVTSIAPSLGVQMDIIYLSGLN